MSREIRPRAPIASPIVFSTEARGLSGKSALTPREQAIEAEVKSVALAQPHRRGHDSEDRRVESALGRFCAGRKPRPLGDHCYHAGIRYAEIVREYKNAMGFDVPGWSPSDGYATMTLEQIAARKELSVMRKRDSDGVLAGLMPRLPRAMERLCFDELTPSIYDEALIADGLVLLARKYGMEPRNIRGPA